MVRKLTFRLTSRDYPHFKVLRSRYVKPPSFLEHMKRIVGIECNTNGDGSFLKRISVCET